MLIAVSLVIGFGLIATCGGLIWQRNTSVSVLPPVRVALIGRSIPLPKLAAREFPLQVHGVPGLSDCVHDYELAECLCASLPYWNPPTVPSLLHELQLWGREAVFDRDVVGIPRSGSSMVVTLLNDVACKAQTSSDGGHYLIDSPFGIHVVQVGTADAKGYRGEGHDGQLLKVLGEVGVPLSTLVTTETGRQGTIGDLLQDSIKRFFLESSDLEFMGIVLSLWLPPTKSWTDRFDQTHTFDDLIEALIARPLGDGSCGGCHVPYAVAVILQVDSNIPILSATSRSRAMTWLNALSEIIDQSQLSQGGWDRKWIGKGRVKTVFGDELLERITITGHHLEWIAIAPEQVRPSKVTTEHAIRSLAVMTRSLPAVSVRSFKSLLPCSHSARALCRMRGQLPFAVWHYLRDSQQVERAPGGGWQPARILQSRSLTSDIPR